MKANEWDKKFLDSNDRKIAKNLLLPQKIKQDYETELELEKKKGKNLTHCQEGKNQRSVNFEMVFGGRRFPPKKTNENKLT